jgi:hypothetical protein
MDKDKRFDVEDDPAVGAVAEEEDQSDEQGGRDTDENTVSK